MLSFLSRLYAIAYLVFEVCPPTVNLPSRRKRGLKAVESTSKSERLATVPAKAAITLTASEETPFRSWVSPEFWDRYLHSYQRAHVKLVQPGLVIATPVTFVEIHNNPDCVSFAMCHCCCCFLLLAAWGECVCCLLLVRRASLSPFLFAPPPANPLQTAAAYVGPLTVALFVVCFVS